VVGGQWSVVGTKRDGTVESHPSAKCAEGWGTRAFGFWGNLGSNKWDYGAVWTYGLLLECCHSRDTSL